MKSEMYQMIADEKELEWFFDHVLRKPQINEAYTMVFVSRHKKLTKEEQKTIGLTRAESEFLSVQTVRPPKVSDMGENKPWEFTNFLRHVKRFNVDKGAYTTALGQPIPEKTLAIIFYANPCNNMKVWKDVRDKVDFAYESISTAALHNQGLQSMYQQYQCFGNVEDHIKHARAKCKGSTYWMDFDVDVPVWFKCDKDKKWNYCREHSKEINGILSLGHLPFSEDPLYTPTEKDYNELEEKWLSTKTDRPDKYYNLMLEKLNNRFGKGHYIIVDTSGGYHILVRTGRDVIKANPHDFCKEVEAIYKQGVADGNPEYLNENGTCKFEAIVNDSQIPGIPLPGTFQYGRPVTVLNKEDFDGCSELTTSEDNAVDFIPEPEDDGEIHIFENQEGPLEKILKESNQGRTESDTEQPLKVTL